MPQRSIKALFFTLTSVSLILLALASLWLYHYFTDTISQKLAHSAHEKSDTIRYEIIQYYDDMIHNFMQSKSAQASKMAQAQSYFIKNGADAPLEPLQRLLEDSESEYDIYLINQNMVVQRTTFLHDLGLDFKQYRYVPKLLTSLFENPAMSDLSEPLYESYTDDFKRYHSQASPKTHCIIQLRQKLKRSESFHAFINHLKELIPTLHSQATYTVSINNDQKHTTSSEIWSQRLSKIKEKNGIKLWGGLGNFHEVIERLDPISKGVLKQPKLYLSSYLSTMFKHNTCKETTYWEHGMYLRMIMLPIQSYYNQLENSYGFLVLELDETQVYDDTQYLKTAIITVWSLIVALIFFMAFLFYRRIIAPVTSLQFHMHHKIPIQDTAILIKGDEVSRMARTYNWLLNDLKNEIQAKQNLLAQFKIFTANAIHQVRTPLSVIKIANSMIDDEHHKEAKMNILSSLVSMEHLYDSLAFTLQNDKIELPATTLDLSIIAQNRVNLFAPVASTMDTQINTSIREDITVEMNQSELEYLIDNNLSNALKYGQPFKPITFILSQSPKESILQFESYGEPIADTRAIFKRYMREDHSKQGSGIGLHIVSTICERYKIIIQVTYEDGKNCFRYFIPTN